MIGVAISTRNRRDTLLEALKHWTQHLPEGAALVVVDDHSEQPFTSDGVTVIRHEARRGIAATKNSGIAALMDRGVEHLFLADDDTWPITGDWWRPYVESDEKYFTYCWTHFAKDGAPVPKMKSVYRDSKLVAYQWSMGCLQYVHRDVINTVGGVNPAFGLAFEEHAEWANRIHNAGFTSFIHQDHPDMKGRIYAGDEHYAVQRSFAMQSRSWKQRLIDKNTALRESLKDSTQFVEYR